MKSNIEFKNGLFGTIAIITGVWNNDYFELFYEKNVLELELNEGKGWKGENVEFLRHIKYLKCLTIIDFKIESIEPIHYLNKLIRLNISTYCNNSIDFKAFPLLTECGFEWIKGSESLFECRSITSLGLNKYINKSSIEFSKLIALERVTLLNSKIENLDGFANLKKITYLSIANAKQLTSIEGIKNLIQLQELEFQSCKKITSIDVVFNLVNLKRLLLIDLGDIKSINGIEKLIDLQELFFYESTNIVDGDLSSIEMLKKLDKISFRNRNHYSHRRENFGKLYS